MPKPLLHPENEHQTKLSFSTAHSVTNQQDLKMLLRQNREREYVEFIKKWDLHSDQQFMRAGIKFIDALRKQFP